MTEKTGTLVDGIVETVKTIVYALLIAGVFRTLLFQPFWIPSGSMKDTLLIGDFLFVNKMAYGYSRYSCPFAICPISGRLFAGEPERGDVVVFRHPVNGQDFIKRLVGLPGDEVQMRSGILHINGAPAPQVADGYFVETYDRQGPSGSIPRCTERQLAQGADCAKEKAIETLPNGVQHSVLNIDERPVRQYRCLYRSRGAFLFHGRQPRQLDRQPRAAGIRRRGVCSVREPDRARGPGDVLVRRAVPVVHLDLAARPVLQEDRMMRLGADMAAFAGRLGHTFSSPELLVRALTHASISGAARPDNQRLEFLGDRVLGLVIAEALLEADGDAHEGQLAPRFNALVRKETCAGIAREIGLGDVLKLGRSEMMSGGRRKQALLGDAMEAVIAAVYADAGFGAARDVILRLWGDRIGSVEADARDAKTSLQEWAQARGLPPPAYEEVAREGPDHAPVFTIEARLQSGETARATAPSKRSAEQAAAKALLSRVE